MRAFGVAWSIRRVAAAAGVVAVVAVAAWAGLVRPLLPRLPSRQTPEPPAAQAARAAAGTAAMRVARDPVTGDLGMPSAADAPMFGSLPEPAAEPRVEILPDGMMILHHEQHFRNYSLAHVGPDGRVVADCVTGADAAPLKRSSPQPVAVPRDALGREVR